MYINATFLEAEPMPTVAINMAGAAPETGSDVNLLSRSATHLSTLQILSYWINPDYGCAVEQTAPETMRLAAYLD